jgi:predicted amidohydrolase YtcJ
LIKFILSHKKETMNSKLITQFSFIIIILISSCSGNNKENTNHQIQADRVFTNGKIYTVNEAQPWAEAVAVKGDKIIFVGDAKGVKGFIGDKTETTDLAGKMMLPGFIDGHLHMMAGGLMARGVNLETDDKEELLARIRKFAEDTKGDVVVAYGWRLHLYPDPGPTKEDLDAIDSERPIFLWAVDGHSAWVNSKALELAGVDKDFPDTQPPFSYFQRDAKGNPTGWIVEVPAMVELFGKLVTMDKTYVDQGVREWLPRFTQAGITAIFDAGIQGMTQDDGLQLYQQYEKEGILPLKVRASYYWNNPDVDPLPPLREFMSKYNSDLVKVTKLKVNIDGGDDKHNAIYIEPYADRPDWYGEPILPESVVHKAIKEADAEGIDAFCHCFGDGANRMFLDAVEEAIHDNPDRDRRHMTSHTMLVHPDDVPRYAELGVIADFQTIWAANDPLITTLNTTRLGKERVDRQIGTQPIANAGGMVSLSSDWPVAGYSATYQPLKTIQGAVTRQMQTEPRGEPLGGVEARMPLADAIKAHTLTAAYGMRMDKETGSIEVGKKADLIVLEKNLFDVDMYDIGAVKVLLTMMNGNITYQAK